MRQSLLSVALAAFAVALTACSEDDSQGRYIYALNGEDSDLSVELPADATEYAVACACSLEPGASCANMVEVDGEYISLGGDIGLGSMEFCGQDGLHAALTGAVEDGSFVATAYELRK